MPDRIEKKGIRIVIGTGNNKNFMNKALKFLKLDNVFDLILTIEDVRESKPSLEIVEKAMKHFSARKDETLFVGDARNDVLSAKNADVKSAVVLTGVLNREEAEKLNPDYILENVLEIEKIID
ncbi:MAG TPA: HAD family hydrolase [Candidatus Altiarchaeales archaeon]|nr:HAD family hydrolase [Candidatus Altiarchaeales archaeon]